MKYICTNPFPNPVGKPIIIADIKDEAGKVPRKQAHVTVGGVECREHVHKGAVFTIGTASEFKDLAPAEKTLVAQLMVSKKIADATDANVKRVDEELAADKVREARDAKRDVKVDPMAAIAEVIGKLPEMIATAVANAIKPAASAK